MKKFDYNKTAATAKRMIDRFGMATTIVVKQYTQNVDAWKPPVLAEVELETVGIHLNIEEKYENGTLIQSASQKVVFYLTGVSLEPNISGEIKQGFNNWKFEKLKITAPGGVVIVYEATVT